VQEKTVVDRPSAPSPSAPSIESIKLTESASIESAITPEQALLLFEARRVWVYAVGLVVAALGGIALALAVGGDPVAQRIHIGCISATVVAAGGYAISARNPRDYKRWKVTAMVWVGLVANASGFYYYGVYSAYAGVVTVSAYAFYSGGGKNTVRGALAFSVIGHGGLGIAQLAGWIEDRGLVQLPLPDGAKLGILLIFQLIMIGAGLAGLHAYNTMQDVIAAHDQAQRALALRDAQLAEAHEAARAARGPGEGRFTGEKLGRFKLAEILGRGAMGEVYAADDERGTKCAVKVLASHLHGNDDALKRFQREARLISGLDVPNIVRMLEVSPASSVVPFIAMERLVGKDLGALIKEQPVRNVGDIVPIVRAVAAGLDAAHDAGVVHRDLKPANIYAATVDGRIEWKILDFGVSKHTDEATLTGAQLVGTPGYMAPEQAKGDAIDRRVDIYALGVVCYRLITGRPAVVPGDAPAMIHEVVYRMPPQPSGLAAISPQIEAVLGIALAKSPDDRFATAGEFAAAFAEAAAGVLPETMLERAEAILRRTPWGSWLRAQTRATTVPARARS
jgi:eukaryotic-like serine/threonine-protein kinase